MTFAGKYNGDDDDLEADAEADEADEVDRFGGFAGEDFPSNELRLRDKVPFQDPFSVAKIVIHMQGLHQTAPFPQNKELVWMK